jgi:hypothetical protein
MTINISLGWYSWPGDNLPPDSVDYFAWMESIPVLVKDKDGDIYYGYLQTDIEEKTYKWKLCGPDGYEIENVIEWAYATPTRTKH